MCRAILGQTSHPPNHISKCAHLLHVLVSTCDTKCHRKNLLNTECRWNQRPDKRTSPLQGSNCLPCVCLYVVCVCCVCFVEGMKHTHAKAGSYSPEEDKSTRQNACSSDTHVQGFFIAWSFHLPLICLIWIYTMSHTTRATKVPCHTWDTRYMCQ